MAKKTAVKKQSARKTSTAATAPKKVAPTRKKTAATKKPAKTVKRSATNTKATKNATKRAIMELLTKGKKQGYLTYDEINELLPEDMLSPEQIDETLINLGYTEPTQVHDV